MMAVAVLLGCKADRLLVQTATVCWGATDLPQQLHSCGMLQSTLGTDMATQIYMALLNYLLLTRMLASNRTGGNSPPCYCGQLPPDRPQSTDSYLAGTAEDVIWCASRHQHDVGILC